MSTVGGRAIMTMSEQRSCLPMTTQQTILELHDVAIAFGGIQALNGVSLQLRLALERV